MSKRVLTILIVLIVATLLGACRGGQPTPGSDFAGGPQPATAPARSVALAQLLAEGWRTEGVKGRWQ